MVRGFGRRARSGGSHRRGGSSKSGRGGGTSRRGGGRSAFTANPSRTFFSRIVVRTAFALPQHRDQHRSERPVLLAVDQEFGEDATLWVAPELSDPVGSLEVGEHQDVEEFGTRSGAERVEAIPEPAPRTLAFGQGRRLSP
jgi:hypothetical protein